MILIKGKEKFTIYLTCHGMTYLYDNFNTTNKYGTINVAFIFKALHDVIIDNGHCTRLYVDQLSA